MTMDRKGQRQAREREQWRRDTLAGMVFELIRTAPGMNAPQERGPLEHYVEKAAERTSSPTALERWLELTDEERAAAIDEYARQRYCQLCSSWKGRRGKRMRLCSSCERAHVHFDDSRVDVCRWYVARKNPSEHGEPWEVVARPKRGSIADFFIVVNRAITKELLRCEWSYASRSAAISRAIKLYGPQKAGE